MSWLSLLLSTSPAPTNPSISTITDVINEMRRNIPDAPALIMCDAPYDSLVFDLQQDLENKSDPSQERFEKRVKRYEEYKLELSKWCDANNVEMMVFDKHTHRANMTRQALKQIKTPVVLTLDHDTLVQGVEWNGMEKAMEHESVNSIRFYSFDTIHPAHQHLVRYPIEHFDGVPLLRTIQYGDCPNLHKTEFLKGIIENYLKPGDKCFVEDRMWPICHNAGWDGWFEFKLWLYAPANMRCRIHTNVRGNWPMAVPVMED